MIESFSPLRHVIPSLTGNLLFKGGADDVVVDDVLEQFIQTNSLIIFTSPYPVLLVPGFEQVGYCEEWFKKNTRRKNSNC
jgi:hypothetical protein